MERRHPDRCLRVLIADDDRDTVTTLTAIVEAEGRTSSCWIFPFRA